MSFWQSTLYIRPEPNSYDNLSKLSPLQASMMRSISVILLLCLFTVFGLPVYAGVLEHTFNVRKFTVKKLCQQSVITAVNSQLPGPTIHVKEGDTLAIHVFNKSPHNITIHWHGIFQLLSAWADGPNHITQCPIRPGGSYTYRFNIIGQEGTLWWHAHNSVLRATVYGALIIKPRTAYPFTTPNKEVPILLGEWYKENVIDLEQQAFTKGRPLNISDALTINGKPGDQFKCSDNSTNTFKMEVEQGKTYLLRIINVALNSRLFFKVARHNFTVVAADASYTVHYNTDILVLSPGQTIDALMVANAKPGSYYMASQAFSTAYLMPFDNTTATGIVKYKSTNATPLMPTMPAFADSVTTDRFLTSLKALIRPGMPTVPLSIDEHMFVTFGLGLYPCGANQPLCQQYALAASMNNVSFQFPTEMSLLEAHFNNVQGVYTSDFPNNPPKVFDYNNNSVSTSAAYLWTIKGTKVKKLKYNSTVEVVLQNTALIRMENHPIHLHGFNFFVVAQGYGKYNATAAVPKYNLGNPQERNTISVLTGGWAVIRFRANNPGVWFLHSQLDSYLPIGLGMAFQVENGGTPSSTLPSPPEDFPQC